MFYVEMSGQALAPTNMLYAMTSQWREEKGEREIGRDPDGKKEGEEEGREIGREGKERGRKCFDQTVGFEWQQSRP